MGRHVINQSGSPATRAANALESAEANPLLLKYVRVKERSMITENMEEVAKNVAARPRKERI
jgi:hypothetical protein